MIKICGSRVSLSLCFGVLDMLTPFVLCPQEDGGIDYSVSSSVFVFHKMSIVPGFKPSVGRLSEKLMNNADE